MERVNMWMIRFRLKCAGVAALLKEEDGIGTVEMILILVGIFTPYYRVDIQCIRLKYVDKWN
jgi:hypothetical protein